MAGRVAIGSRTVPNMVLQVREVGASDGPAVLYFHGTAATADEGPDASTVLASGVRMFLVRRPGYGAEPPKPRASLAALGVTELISLGWSGGGPYALASAVAAPSIVRGVGLVASWAPMDPPHPGLPRSVRSVMSIARWLPRPALRVTLALTGRRNPGQVDDIRRTARPWGFTPDDVAAGVPVVVWHSEDDEEVPIEPWTQVDGIELRHLAGGRHDPDSATWQEVLDWARDTAMR